jgi:hypothetical protein
MKVAERPLLQRVKQNDVGKEDILSPRVILLMPLLSEAIILVGKDNTHVEKTLKLTEQALDSIKDTLLVIDMRFVPIKKHLEIVMRELVRGNNPQGSCPVRIQLESKLRLLHASFDLMTRVKQI